MIKSKNRYNMKLRESKSLNTKYKIALWIESLIIIAFTVWWNWLK